MPRESAAGRLKNAIAEAVKFMINNIGFDGLRASEKNNSTSGGILVRLLRYIQRHVSRYAPLNVPCRRTQIRRNLVELFLTATLSG
jgi:hypothetical protein